MKPVFVIGSWRFDRTTNIDQLRAWSQVASNKSQYYIIEVRPAKDNPTELVLKYYYRLKRSRPSIEEEVQSFVLRMAASLQRRFGRQLLGGKVVFGAEQAIRKRTIIFSRIHTV